MTRASTIALLATLWLFAYAPQAECQDRAPAAPTAVVSAGHDLIVPESATMGSLCPGDRLTTTCLQGDWGLRLAALSAAQGSCEALQLARMACAGALSAAQDGQAFASTGVYSTSGQSQGHSYVPQSRVGSPPPLRVAEAFCSDLMDVLAGREATRQAVYRNGTVRGIAQTMTLVHPMQVAAATARTCSQQETSSQPEAEPPVPSAAPASPVGPAGSPLQIAPRHGGCAGCTISGRSSPPLSVVFALLALVLCARRRRQTMC